MSGQRPPIDPVCAIHGKRWSEHRCLYCCHCFDTLTDDECWTDSDGHKWDVCKPCKAAEDRVLAARG